MKTVAYGGESFTTSDDAAEALLGFAAAAALHEFAAVIHVPALSEGGGLFVVDLVIGPSSEMMVVPADSEFAEPDTVEASAELRRMTARLGSARVCFGGAIATAQLDDGSELTELD